MVTLGVDAHKRTHTIVADDANGRQLACKTIATTTKDHLGQLTWAEELANGDELLWAVEDCRHLSRRLERDLLSAGQAIVRVPPKLMANVPRTQGCRDRPNGRDRQISGAIGAKGVSRRARVPLALTKP
jgi:transposase